MPPVPGLLRVEAVIGGRAQGVNHANTVKRGAFVTFEPQFPNVR